MLQLSSSRERTSARVAVDNWGSGPVGPVQARLSVDLYGLLAADDRLSAGGVITPLDPGEFQLAHAAYAKPLGTNGTEAFLRGYVGRTEPGGILAERNLEGLSYQAEAGLSHPLVRSRAASLWLTGSLAVRQSDLEEEQSPLRRDRIVAASLSLNAAGRIAGGHAGVRLGVAQGLNLFGATGQGDPLASRPDASGVFTKLHVSGRYDQALGDGFTFALGGEGQIAGGPLLASEEMGLGGRDFLRAFDYRERAGDTGAAAFAELRLDVRGGGSALDRAQVYAYGDAGRVRNIGGGYGDGSLASAGGGVRLWLKPRVQAAVEIGFPITENGAGGSSSPRISVQTSASF